MKTVETGQFSANLEQYLRDARTEIVVVTRSGTPCAVVHGLDYDAEQIKLISSKEFWSMIELRRQQPNLSWDVVKSQLEALED